MRILFAGTQSIAVPTLRSLASHNIVQAVLTTPDAPGKRGRTLIASPVKQAALELGLPVIQPEHLKKEAREEVMRYNPDTLVTFCYGKIFGPRFLSLFERKFNIHPSLLPRYRGCAPIQNAILNQDRCTGISIQDISLAVDEGDIYITQSLELDGSETTESLEERVSQKAAKLAVTLLSSLDSFKSRPQDSENVSYTRMVEKEDGCLDFTKSARSLHAAIRAYSTWPKAYCMCDGQVLYLLSVSGSVFDIEECECKEAPGTVVSHDKKLGFRIATGSGYLYVNRLQVPARNAVDSTSFLNGRRDFLSKVLE